MAAEQSTVLVRYSNLAHYRMNRSDTIMISFGGTKCEIPTPETPGTPILNVDMLLNPLTSPLNATLLRPVTFTIFQGTNITIQNITMINSPNWFNFVCRFS